MKPDQLSVAGLQPGMTAAILLPRIPFGKTESTDSGWRFTGANYIVTVHKNRPYVISSVRDFGNSGLTIDGIQVTSPNQDIGEFLKKVKFQDWLSLEGEPGRYYWKLQDDIYLRIRTQPKSLKIHEIALFDSNSVKELTLRKPAFLSLSPEFPKLFPKE